MIGDFVRTVVQVVVQGFLALVGGFLLFEHSDSLFGAAAKIAGGAKHAASAIAGFLNGIG